VYSLGQGLRNWREEIMLVAGPDAPADAGHYLFQAVRRCRTWNNR
jgi:hypothetical protein